MASDSTDKHGVFFMVFLSSFDVHISFAPHGQSEGQSRHAAKQISEHSTPPSKTEAGGTGGPGDEHCIARWPDPKGEEAS